MNYWLSITPKSPLYIGFTKPKFNFLFTQDVIPGSVLRGAIAEYFLYRQEDSKILEFLEVTRFGFFRPSATGLQVSLPLPLSSLSCKRYQGFKSLGDSHGVMDSLISLVAYKELGKELENMGSRFAVSFLLRCEKCNSRMEKFSGFYVKNGSYKDVNVTKSSQTKVAINRKRKSAEEGLLYSVTAIEPRIVFTGRICIDENKIPILKQAIEKMGIGGLTTRGYGRVEIRIEDDLLTQSEDDIKKRINSFNSKLNECWTDLLSINLSDNSLPEKPEDLYFSAILISP